MKRINFPLLLGTLIVLALLAMAFFPELFTDQDPLFESSAKYIEVKIDGEWVEKFGHNPMPPNKENIMGTDDAGRDVYTRLVYGTKNTLKLVFLIAFFRMCIAFPLGMAAGMGAKPISAFIRVFNTFFTAVPILIFSIIILNIAYFRQLQMDMAITAFAVVLTALGWAKLAGMIEDRTRNVMDDKFIEGEIAIGKTKLQIAYQNVLPHIIPDATSLFFKEMGMAMFLIAQLAVFNVFVGVARRVNALAFRANYEMILEPEWGGTLSRIAVNLRKFDAVYWMTVYPIILFSIAIMGLNLLGEGLRMEFQKRNSRVISHIRKAYYFISPKMFIAQIKAIQTYYRQVLVKIAIIVFIIAYAAIPWHPSQHKFDIERAMSHVHALTQENLKGREAGTEGGQLAGEYIKSALLSYGYIIEEMPIEFVSQVDGKEAPQDLTPVSINDGYIKITNQDGIETTFELYKDFAVLSVNRNAYASEPSERLIYNGYGANASIATPLKEGDTIIPLSTSYPNLHEYYARQISQYSAEILMSGRGYGAAVTPQIFNTTAIIPFIGLYEALNQGRYEIEINLSYPKPATYPGRNIMGYKLGKGKTLEQPGEIVIIGAAYDGTYAGESSV
ncbi:MAG TPA: hypothetical protein DCS67_05550, partial [Clostridiales bacterium UBA8960]|nr:hypothetical protein [Clostridiales bacterium UBA8960]